MCGFLEMFYEYCFEGFERASEQRSRRGIRMGNCEISTWYGILSVRLKDGV